MLIVELTVKKYHFVGTCVNSFDEEGNCIVNQLPWSDVTEFAQDEEDHFKPITSEEFNENVDNVSSVYKPARGLRPLKFYSFKNVLVLYDTVSDVHYFFVK